MQDAAEMGKRQINVSVICIDTCKIQIAFVKGIREESWLFGGFFKKLKVLHIIW